MKTYGRFFRKRLFLIPAAFKVLMVALKVMTMRSTNDFVLWRSFQKNTGWS